MVNIGRLWGVPYFEKQPCRFISVVLPHRFCVESSPGIAGNWHSNSARLGQYLIPKGGENEASGAPREEALLPVVGAYGFRLLQGGVKATHICSNHTQIRAIIGTLTLRSTHTHWIHPRLIVWCLWRVYSLPAWWVMHEEWLVNGLRWSKIINNIQ